jgi:hypothetical protein
MPIVGFPADINFFKYKNILFFFKFLIASVKLPTPGRIRQSAFFNTFFLLEMVISNSNLPNKLINDARLPTP